MIRKATKTMAIFLLGLFFAVSQFIPVALADEQQQQQQNAGAYSLTPQEGEKFLSSRDLQSEGKWRNGKYDCYKETKGELTEYCIKSDERGKKDASVYTRGGSRRGCEVVSVAWYNNKDCSFCNLLVIAYKASDIVTSKAFETFAYSFSVLMVVIFAIWVAIKTLSHVSLLTPQDAAKYITDILLQAFKFLLAYFALHYYMDVFDRLILPIFNSGLAFADAFVSTGLDTSDYHLDLSRVSGNKMFKAQTYEYIGRFAYDVNMQFSLLQTVGKVLRCLGGKYMTLFNIGEQGINFGLGVNCLIYGLLFGVLGLLLSLVFVFYLFDAVIELGIFGAVLPFAIACWPFKMFTKSASNAMKLFMNSMFTFMMAGVAVKVCIELISNAMGGSTGEGDRGMSLLVQSIDTLDVGRLKSLLGIINVSFLVFAFAALSGFMLVGKIQVLTNTFASGGMSPTASRIATMGASAVKGAAKKLTAPTRAAVNKKMGDVTKKVAGAIGRNKVVQGAASVVSGAAKIGIATAVAGPVGLAAGGVVAGAKAVQAIKRASAKRRGKKASS